MKSHWVMVVFRLVLDRWVEGVREPSAVCVLAYDRFLCEGEALTLAPWEARISFFLTM